MSFSSISLLRFSRGRSAAWHVRCSCLLAGGMFLWGTVTQPQVGWGQSPRVAHDGPIDLAEKLRPKAARTEQEEDHLYAAAQYALGRLLLQRDDAAGALRRLQRAFRYDPQAATIGREIVAVASSLQRNFEAARYAILAAELEADNPDLLRRLGELLVEQGELERAIALFKKALGILDAGQDRSSSAVLLHAEVGRLYLALKKYPEAAEGLQALDRALLHPEEHGFEGEVKTRLLAEQARLWPLIGESLLRVGRFADAEDRFRRGHEAKPNAPLLAFHLARIAAEKRDWTTARAELEKYRAAPGALAGEQAYELLSRIVAAEVMDQANRQSRLIEELARWRDQDRGNATLAYYLAGQYVDAGQTELALRLYEELLGGEPRPDALRALARMYHKRRDTASMLRLFDKTPASLLANEEPWAGIARDEEYWHGLLAALVPAAGASAYGANPSGNRYVGTALLGIHAEQWDTVEKLFGQALDLPGADGDNICETVGLALLRAEQPARAARIFQRAVSRLDAGEKATSANRASSYFYLAAAEAFAGHTDAALAAAEKCAELMPDSVQFQARPAWVLYHAKRWSDSEPRYRKVLEQFDARFDSESQREQVKQLRLVLSNICVMEQRIAEAEEWLEQVLDEFPEDPGALNDLGYLWVDQSKRLQRALGMCQQAVRAEPENGAYRDSLGWAYFRLHRFEEAIQELEMAARLTPDGVILDHLGDAYRGAQQRDKALSAWQRAVEAFRQDDEAEKRRQTEDKLERLRRSQPS